MAFQRSSTRRERTFLRLNLPVLLVMLLLPACTASQATRLLEPLHYALPPGMAVIIEIPSGALLLTNGEASQVTLSSELSISQEAQITTSSDPESLHLLIQDQGAAPLTLFVPPEASVHIKTFDAELSVQDFEGSLRIDSTAGDSHLQDCHGQVVVVANRGDASFQSCQGELTLFGNYGYLSLEDVSGTISASTIMGTIHYAGRVARTDQVHLETDHGPVEVWLDTNSDVSVTVSTTIGVVDCVLPGLQPAGAGCAGILGSNGGILEVRSVSGEVDVQRLP